MFKVPSYWARGLKSLVIGQDIERPLVIKAELIKMFVLFFKFEFLNKSFIFFQIKYYKKIAVFFLI